jgi:hypothetical protein
MPGLAMTNADRIATAAVIVPVGLLAATIFPRLAIWLANLDRTSSTVQSRHVPIGQTLRS